MCVPIIKVEFKMKDFTIIKYKQLLKALQSRGFFFMSFEQFIKSPKNKFIVLRHDVDKLPLNSLKTAQIEQDLGIKGTYYFRSVPESYDEKIIKQIADLGHEIGYHYENLSLAAQKIKNSQSVFPLKINKVTVQVKLKIENGKSLQEENYKAAIDDFRLNLKKLRNLYPVKTICMHGSPLSKYDNRLLWEKYDYKDFGIIGEPYFDIDFREVLYLTDTGRRWDGERVSVRDKVNIRDVEQNEISKEKRFGREGVSVKDKINSKLQVSGSKSHVQGYRFRSTVDIIEAAKSGLLPDKIMITVHPQRWSDRFLPWTKELFFQNFKNVGKYLIVKFKLPH